MIINESLKYDLIVFDLDGTLYDINDVYDNVYHLQIEYLSKKLHINETSASKMLEMNHIYHEMRPDSRSATEFFARIGIDIHDWTMFRNANIDFTSIDKRKSVKNETILLFAQYSKLLLVSSNTSQIIMKILNHLGISVELFEEIIGSDSSCISGIFSKRSVFKSIKDNMHKGGKILAVGDRYETDILPMLDIGGDGALIKTKRGVSSLYNDLIMNSISNDGYQFFCR